jgi:Ca2+-binding EF-hand superfamily protein
MGPKAKAAGAAGGGTAGAAGDKKNDSLVPKMYVRPTKPAPEIRADIRNYIKNERDTILRKWQSLQEALNAENRIKEQFEVRHEKMQTKSMPPVILKFIRTLKRAVRSTMVVKGGTPFSIIRSMFLYWDLDKSGELGDEELERCMLALGVKMEKSDRDAIIRFYDSGKGTGEMAYNDLLEDIRSDEPTLTMTLELPKDSPRDTESRFKSADDAFAVMPPLVEQFIDAVRSSLRRKMALEGGTELSHLRYAFLMFDHDYSNALDETELSQAMFKNLNIVITPEQAKEVVRFYDRKRTGQMDYHLLLQDVVKGQPLMLQHPEHSARYLAQTKKSLETNPFLPKPYTPAPNKRLEQFKRQVVQVLNLKIRNEGGSLRSWLRQAFVAWDPKFCGKIGKWQDLQGAIRLVGINISQDDAMNLIKIYDTDNSGEMNYKVFMEDLLANERNIIVDTDAPSLTGRSVTARCPPDISMAIRKFRRAAEVYTKKSENGIEAKDLLHGTFLRFDSTRSGRMSSDDLLKVARELKMNISDEEAVKMCNWFDSNGSGKLEYTLLVRQLFGDDVLTRAVSLPPMKERTVSDIKETKHAKAIQSAARAKQIMAEKLKVELKLQALESQKQALIEYKKHHKSS